MNWHILLVLAGLGTDVQQPACIEDYPKNYGQMTVAGEAKLAMKPDFASFQFEVLSRQNEASEALTGNNKAVGSAMALLEKLGVEKHCITTAGFSLEQVWEPKSKEEQTPVLRGYLVRNTVFVTVKQLDNLGKIMDGLVRGGVTNVQGLRMGVSEERVDMDDLKEKAVRQAVARAERMAKAAGVRLGVLRSISFSGGRAMPAYAARASMTLQDAAPGEVPVSAGETKSSVVVNLTYDLVPMTVRMRPDPMPWRSKKNAEVQNLLREDAMRNEVPPRKNNDIRLPFINPSHPPVDRIPGDRPKN